MAAQGDKIRVKVEIAGRSYTLMGSGDTSEARIREVASMVDESMRTMLRSGGLDFPRAAVLTAINMADEFVKVRLERDRLLGERERAEAALAETNRQLSAALDQIAAEKGSLEERLRREYEERLAGLGELQGELERLRAENERLKAAAAEGEQLKERLAWLEEEHRKLKREFDDWMNLIEQDRTP